MDSAQFIVFSSLYIHHFLVLLLKIGYMNRLLEIVKNPIVCFAALLVFVGLYQAFNSAKLDSVIRSDGRGYYAYLPAVFIYNDATFQASMEAEKRRSPLSTDQLYVYKD